MRKPLFYAMQPLYGAERRARFARRKAAAHACRLRNNAFSALRRAFGLLMVRTGMVGQIFCQLV